MAAEVISTFEEWPVLHLHRNSFPLVFQGDREDVIETRESVQIARNRQNVHNEHEI